MMPLPALEGLRVLDLSRVLAGPLTAQIFADLGADVIKIERPGRGDDTREWGPCTDTAGSLLNESVYFWSCNRGKRSVTADLASDSGRALVSQLADSADVVIENYKVDTLSRYGLDYQTLARRNPRLIYCSITGFGQTGPYRQRPGYDTIIQALGGLMSITGDAEGGPGAGPRKAGLAVTDQLTALYAAVGILAALRERDLSGLGQHIDMALLDVQVAALTNIGMNYLATGEIPKAMGNRLSTVYPSDNFRCKDGEVMLIVGNDQQFDNFCRAMDLPEVSSDNRFSHNAKRLANVATLGPILAAAFRRRTVAESLAALDMAGVPAAPINNVGEVFENPQVVARNLVRQTSTSDGKIIRTLANPIRFSRSPMRDDQAPPLLGEHSGDPAACWSI
jgi:crotonobetainyl-CoA:carnitine CoA-transferase CaiB-like acyl-CoA transferase